MFSIREDMEEIMLTNGFITECSANGVNLLKCHILNSTSSCTSSSNSQTTTNSSTAASAEDQDNKAPDIPAYGSSRSSLNKSLKTEYNHLKYSEKNNEKRRIFLATDSLTRQHSTDENNETEKETDIEQHETVVPINIPETTEQTPSIPDIDGIIKYQRTALPKQNGAPSKPPLLNRTNCGDSKHIIKTVNNHLTTNNTSYFNNQHEKQDHKMPEKEENESQRTSKSPPIDGSIKDISVKHYERLIEELKCPGCAYPMKAPIYLCKTGHSICEQCTRILFLCPLCKEPFTELRSRTVEALCSKAHFKCSNAAGGCTVRLQIDLLSWHEKQCIYKPMKCFMGRVWGDCQWSGREAFWKDHLETAHDSKVFFSDCVDLTLDVAVKNKSLTGYYVLQVFDEMFNFYEVYDKDRILFTMTCTSTQREKKHQFAYEVTVVHYENDALAITQKFPVHSEYDADILAEGTCVSIFLNDLTKFIDEDKFVNYRVKVVEVKSPRRSRRGTGTNTPNLPIDFKQTQIQGVNLKNVPADVIVTRRLQDLTTNDNGANSENELDRLKREFNEKLAKSKQHDSGSDSDPEFEAFLTKKWGTPQLHFNRKYLKVNNSSDSSSNEGSSKGVRTPSQHLTNDKLALVSTNNNNNSYKKKMTNSLRKSFNHFKTDVMEIKPFGRKNNSPEKQKLEK